MPNEEIYEQNFAGAKKWWRIWVYLTTIGLIGFVIWVTYLTQNLSTIIENQNNQQIYLEKFDHAFDKFDSMQQMGIREDRKSVV